MKRQIVSITAAFFLGIVVMLMPILTYTQFLGDNGANTLGAESSEQRDSYDSTSWKTLDEAAQKLGKINTSPTSFPTSLTQTILLSATSLITALITTLLIRRKIKFAVQDLTTLNQTKK